MSLTSAELPVYAAAWRLAAEITNVCSNGEVVPVLGRTDVLVRGGGINLATFVFGEEPEVRSASLPPIPAEEWAWPMPDRELRRLGMRLSRGGRPRARYEDDHPVGWVTARVVSRVLAELVMREDHFGLVDPRDRSHAGLTWLPDVSDARGEVATSSAWLLHVRADVIGVFRGGWFYTPRGEAINLHARYLAGASIQNLADTVLWPERPGSRPRPGWLPTELVVDMARAGEDLSHVSVETLKAARFSLFRGRHLTEDPEDALIAERLAAEIERRKAD